MEIWKRVKNFPNYDVSNTGRVRSRPRVVPRGNGKYRVSKREMSQVVCKNGYKVVRLRRKNVGYTVYVHHIVANAFLRKRKKTEQINHKDFVKINNNVLNLEVLSQKENLAYTRASNRHAYGERTGNSVLREKDILTIRALLEDHSQVEIAKMFNVCSQTIWCVANNKTWNHVKGENKCRC